ncbi:hypothetical protein [Hyphococcus lacteus]|uniref:HEAT repeat domain-containing protein n=1 Tax=Hyphococcus lacteus TaxID=3143536 RepID=A0ABV3Z7Z4_9PROT
MSIRSYKLWPAKTISIFDHLTVHGDGGSSQSEIDSAIADINADIFPLGIEPEPFAANCAKALQAFTKTQSALTARNAYAFLSAHHFRKEIVDLVAKRASIANALPPPLIQLFQDCLQHSPHWVVVRNILSIMKILKALPMDDQVIFLERVSMHHQFIGEVPNIPSEADFKKDGLLFSLAKAGDWEAQDDIIESLTPNSSLAVKEWVLRHGYDSVPSPETMGEYDPTYIAYIQNLFENTDMLGVISQPSIDDGLAVSILHYLSDLASGAVNDVTWTDPKLFENETEILFRLIDHLEGRELDLPELYALAYIYEELLGPNSDDIILRTPQGDSVMAKKVLAVFDVDENRTKIDTALSSTQSTNFMEALAIVVQTRGWSRFDTLLKALRADFPRRGSTPLRTGLIGQLADSIQNRSEAEQASQWCIDYFRIHANGYSTFTRQPDFDKFVSILLQTNARYTGVAPALVLAGLDSVGARRAAAELLLAWHSKDYPDDIARRIENAINDQEVVADKLKTIQVKMAQRLLH